MAQLTANQVNIYDSNPQTFNAIPISDNVIVWKGSAVGNNAGFARQLVANDIFLGFAEQHIDNTVTGHSAGALSVPVMRSGVIQAIIATVAQTDINRGVYMSDGNTFTYTSSGNTFIGRVIRVITTGTNGLVAVDFSVTAQANS